MTRPKLIALGLAALLVTLGLGYVWGASGRFTLANALDDTRQQLDLAEARGHLLDARVSLYNANFGDATRAFDAADAPLRRAQARYQDTGDNRAAGNIATALEHLAEAKRLAAALDQGANAKAGDALEAIKVATTR